MTLGSCENFADDVQIDVFNNEKDLILGFTELIKIEQPNIITGWNIFKFDTEFMIERAQINGCFFRIYIIWICIRAF